MESLTYGTSRGDPASDERPTTHGGDCLWLLTFAPDQVHSSPLRGPLIRNRTATVQGYPPFVRDGPRGVKGVAPEVLSSAPSGL